MILKGEVPFISEKHTLTETILPFATLFLKTNRFLTTTLKKSKHPTPKGFLSGRKRMYAQALKASRIGWSFQRGGEKARAKGFPRLFGGSFPPFFPSRKGVPVRHEHKTKRFD